MTVFGPRTIQIQDENDGDDEQEVGQANNAAADMEEEAPQDQGDVDEGQNAFFFNCKMKIGTHTPSFNDGG